MAAEERVIDRAVAIVDGQTLTLSQLEFEARLLLIRAGGAGAVGGPLDDETLRSALETIVGHILLVHDAERLSAFAIDPELVEQELQKVRAVVGAPEVFSQLLQRYEADEQVVRAVVSRAVRAERVLQSRVRIVTDVSAADVDRFRKTHPELRGAGTELVKQRLQADRYRAAAVEELKRVRQHADVRFLGPFAIRGDAGRP